MFDLFKRRRKLEEVTGFLTTILEKLPQEDPRLRAQLEAGIIRGIGVTKSRFEFCHNRKVARRYESIESSSYSIEGIRVRDHLTSDFVPVELHIAFGLITGYSVKARNFDLDPSVMDVSNARKKFRINTDFEFVKKNLKPCEWSLLDPDDVYRVAVEGKDVIHLMDVGQDDFMAMDREGALLIITHNPVEYIKLDMKLAEAIMEYATPMEVITSATGVPRLASPAGSRQARH